MCTHTHTLRGKKCAVVSQGEPMAAKEWGSQVGCGDKQRLTFFCKGLPLSSSLRVHDLVLTAPRAQLSLQYYIKITVHVLVFLTLYTNVKTEFL